MNPTPHNPTRNANGAFPNVTTFANEKRLLTVGRECLVEVDKAAGAPGRMLVAVTRDGFRTDYPITYESGAVAYDNPELFSKRFKERAKRFILANRA